MDSSNCFHKQSLSLPIRLPTYKTSNQTDSGNIDLNKVLKYIL
jgi:hypothetical protein